MKELEEKQSDGSKNADEYEKKHTEISKIIDQLRRGLYKICYILKRNTSHSTLGLRIMSQYKGAWSKNEKKPPHLRLHLYEFLFLASQFSKRFIHVL